MATKNGFITSSLLDYLTHFTLILLFLPARDCQLHTSCYAFGTEHILTFDRQRIDISSKCNFALVSTCPAGVKVPAQLQISLQNVMVDDVSRVSCVQILYASSTVLLCDDQTATVDGKPVTNLLAANFELMIYTGTSGKSAAIHVTDPLTNATESVIVSISPSSAVRVNLPDSYKGKLCGLCGNFDDDPINDLRTADGIDVSTLSLPEQGAAIAGSYLMAQNDVLGCQSSSDVIAFTHSDCVDLFNFNVSIDIIAPLYCGVYDTAMSTDFQSCITAQPDLAQTFQEMCIYDFCENYLTASSDVMIGSGCLDSGECEYNRTTAKEAVNRVAEVFVDSCRALGHEFSSWRADYEADLTCSGDTSYTFTGPKCPNVCSLPSDICQLDNRDGCACPTGQFKDGSYQCVDQSVCGCTDSSDGSYYMIGDSWVDSTCSTEQTCDATDSITINQIVCSRYATCEKSGGGTYSCVCDAEYQGDGYVCTRLCPAGWQPTDDHSACEKCPIGTYQPLENQLSCLSCPSGQVTSELGATSNSSCTTVTIVPDSPIGNSRCVNDVHDLTYETVVPSTVLPDGIPFGERRYTNFYTSTNGLISFGQSFRGTNPVRVSSLEAQGFDVPLAAIYWVRQDLRRSTPEGLATTRLCMTSYNIVDGQEENAEESQVITTLIKYMLDSSPKLKEINFKPTYAFVATWYHSVAFPYVWYDTSDYQEYATYQGVIATDGTRTYLMYIYPTGVENTKLRRLNYFRNIHMGYNAQDGVNVFDLYLSRTSEITGIYGEPSNTDVSNRWVFSVSESGTPNPHALACIDWYRIQKTIYTSPVVLLSPCPCNRLEALYDHRFFYDRSIHCAFTLLRFGYELQRLMCCYNPFSGSLLSSPALAGFTTQYSSVTSPNLFARDDIAIFDSCCVYSDYCFLFREIKPQPICTSYLPPLPAFCFGDPHISTLDNFLYTYNPIGEFWMIKSQSFLVQARILQSANSQGELVNATQFQAYAMQSIDPLSDRIHVELNNNRTDLLLYRNGESLTHLIDFSVNEGFIEFSKGAIRKTNDSIIVAFDAGYTFRLAARFEILRIDNMIPDSAKGAVSGLLGNGDGNSTNDLVDSSGKLVCTPDTCTDRLIHTEFGESWRIDPSESIFWYRTGWDSNTYTDKNFEPTYFDMASVNQTVQDVCGDDQTCMFDTLALDSSEIGQYTSLIRGENTDLFVTLANNPPTISGPTRIDALVNQSLTVSYTYNDIDGDDVRLVVTSYPEGAEITESAGTWMMTWTPTNYSAVSLSMYAVEDQPVNGRNITSEELNVMFRLTPDCQNGEPNYGLLAPGGTVTSLFSIYTCNCTLGYEGAACETDIDGCADNPCYNATCIDIPANETDGIRSYTCAEQECAVGFNRTEDSLSSDCFDLDECVLFKPCPDDLCINTYGSFICNCATGFAKHGGDGALCEDIDECKLNLDDCSDICTNTNGTYECSCFPGGTLMSDNVTCEISTVSNQLCGGLYNCSYACGNNTNGEEVCQCPRNRMLNPDDNSTCMAFDECLESSDNACDTASGALCENLPNGYQCTCPVGYSLDSNGLSCDKCPVGNYGKDCLEKCHCKDNARTCDHVLGCTGCNSGWEGDQCKTDRDECAEDPNLCSTNSQCVNTNGSYVCVCNTGYALNPATSLCGDVDECLNHPCSDNAACANTPGSFTCTCDEGFEGDGITCYNINECLLKPSRCVPLAKCEDMKPGYGCICRLGYTGDGKVNSTECKDEDECKETGLACPASNSRCVNTEGSYICECEQYYTGDAYTNCTDIDECALGTADCTPVANGDVTCINEEPLFRCEVHCHDGYIKHVVGGIESCRNINECTQSPPICPGDHVTCRDTEGSHQCICDDNFEKVNGVCEDINECEDTSLCSSDGHVCVNIVGGHQCSCLPGHVEPDCTVNPTSFFLGVSQTLDIPFLAEWADSSSLEFIKFREEFEDTVEHLFNLTDGYEGINIISINSDPDNPNHTEVKYEVVYNEEKIPVDLEHIVFHKLIENKFSLLFNGTKVQDIGQLTFNDTVLDCSFIRCKNNFTCKLETYPYCDCSADYSGYDCSIMVISTEEPATNLLPLWISVGIASALLVVGLGACCAFLAVSYRRRHVARRPPIHRAAKGVTRVSRGPAIFNPTQRMPTEAYNYQFPTGSVRSLSTDSSSSSSHRTSVTSGAVGRVGSTIPFAPRWPRAYYKQLGESED